MGVYLQEYEEMEEQSSRLMKELEQEKLKLEMDVDSLQKNQVQLHVHVVNIRYNFLPKLSKENLRGNLRR